MTMSETHIRPENKDEKFAAARVIRSSNALGNLEKLVWCETLYLDQGPTGAYVSASGLADRLGRSKDRIEAARAKLKSRGLLWKKQCEGERTPSWFAVLPVDCLPTSGRVKQPEIRKLADLLDRQCDRNDMPDLRQRPAEIAAPTTRENTGSQDGTTTRGNAGSTGVITTREITGIYDEAPVETQVDHPRNHTPPTCETTGANGGKKGQQTERQQRLKPTQKHSETQSRLSKTHKTQSQTEGGNNKKKTEGFSPETNNENLAADKENPNQREAPPGYEWVNERQLRLHGSRDWLSPGDTLRVLTEQGRPAA